MGTRQWDKDAEFGSDIHGIGNVFGDLAGKVKTRPIGFVRRELPAKNRVSKQRRGETGKAQADKGQRTKMRHL